MPTNTNVLVAANQWTLLTSADVTDITVQLVSGQEVILTAAVGATPPAADSDAGVRIYAGQGFKNEPLTDLFPGVAGANRIYAKSRLADATVFVSHV